MKRLILLLFISLSAAKAETIDALIKEAAANNPELAFYEKQVGALPKALADSPVIPQPLDFPARESLRSAVLNLDAPLARLYLEQFRFVLASTVRLKAIEYQAESEAAVWAADSAKRTTALVRMLEQRPAAGNEALVERRILEGAALPFIGEAARARVEVARLRLELNGLLGRKSDTKLTVEEAFTLPPEPSTVPSGNLTSTVRNAEIERGLSGLDAAVTMEAFTAAPWFSQEDTGDVLTGFTRPSGTGATSPASRRERLIEDAREKISRELTRRSQVSAAAREVATAVPEKLVQNLKAAAELADRQYRVGALPVNLVLEVNRESLGAITTRNDAILRAWRSSLDVDLLSLATQSTTKP
jgi:cobalt-zinc-cadmium efflux system outer membrane protein